MDATYDDEQQDFAVVVNRAGQYAIWPVAWGVPAGWTETGTRGPKSACLAAIETLWLDLRPHAHIAQA